MRHAVFCALAIAAALVQVVFVDGLPLAGGGVPDIALVLVITLGLTKGPVAGMLTGFCAGLTLDLAPPGGYLIGGSALAFCLIGYGSGRIVSGPGGSVLRLLTTAAIAICAGEVAQAGCGLMAGNSGATLAAVRQGLPAAVLYDVLLCAALLLAVVIGSRSRFGRSPAGEPRIGPPLVSAPGVPAIRFGGQAQTGTAGRSEPSRLSRPVHGTDGVRGTGPRPDLGDSAIRPRPGLASRPVRLRLGARGGGRRRQPGLRRQPVRLRGRARLYRRIPRWHGARTTRHGGMAWRRPGGLR